MDDGFQQGVLPLPAFIGRPMQGIGHHVFAATNGQRGVGRNFVGQGFGAMKSLAGGGKQVDQAPLPRFSGRHHLACQCILHGDLARNALGQTQQTTRPRDQTTLDLGQAKLRVVCSDDEVAGQRNFKTTSQSKTLNSSDDWLLGGCFNDAAQTTPRQFYTLATHKSFEVHASAKMSALARQNAHRDAIIAVELVHGVSQSLGCGAVNRIAHSRSAKCDDKQPAFLLYTHGSFSAHGAAFCKRAFKPNLSRITRPDTTCAFCTCKMPLVLSNIGVSQVSKPAKPPR